MQIKIFCIEKNSNKEVEDLCLEYKKMISRYASFADVSIFDKQIAQAQTQGAVQAKNAYTKAYEPYLKGYNIALDVTGKEYDSFEFSKIFDGSVHINFFIGGAFGFENEFLKKTQRVISLSKLTYAHKIAKVVLYEQIYRGLCIKNNHPYHK
jgi:23S rRNA (pseudouridine1915-N3)-methyltransferase